MGLKVKGLTQNKTSDNISHKQDMPIPKHQRSSERSMTPTFSHRQRPVALQDAVAHVPALAQPTLVPQDDDIQEVVPVKSEPVGHIPETQLNNPHQETPNHVVDPLPVDNQMAMYDENYDNYETYEEGGEMNYDGSMISIGNTDANKDFHKSMIWSKIVKLGVGSYQCTACGLEKGTSGITALKNHVESKHLPRIDYPCEICGKILINNNQYNQHLTNRHRNEERNKTYQ